MAIYNFSDVVNKNGGKGNGKSGNDLYSKLTLLYKHGIGTKYSVKPTSLDLPVKSTHQKKLADQFAKATSDYYMRVTQVTPDRFRSYEDFMAMDYTPEIASALDIYADESLTLFEDGSTKL